MRERVLVDGHNAMHRLGIADGPQKPRREEIVRRVGAIARTATVYFDAHRGTGEPQANTQMGSVRVVYCYDAEADHEILTAVRDADDPRALLVVSDDREVTGKSRQLGARASTVADFFGRVPIGGRAAAQRRSPQQILQSLEDAPKSAPRKPLVEDAMTPWDFDLPEDVDLGEM